MSELPWRSKATAVNDAFLLDEPELYAAVRGFVTSVAQANGA